MTRDEAIAFLAACKPLADRLAAQGIYIELTDADRAILANFTRVDLDDWLDDSNIAEEAGLLLSDIIMLSLMASRVRAISMRRQHEEGEQLPD